MIQFKDFIIKTTKEGGWLNEPEFELVEETLLRLNSWIQENEIIVLNVESILLPNIFKGTSGRTSTKGAYKSIEPNGTSNWWNQIFRVWFQV